MKFITATITALFIALYTTITFGAQLAPNAQEYSINHTPPGLMSVSSYCSKPEDMLNAIIIMVNTDGDEEILAYMAETPGCYDGITNPELVRVGFALEFGKKARTGSARRRNGEKYSFNLVKAKLVPSGEIVYSFIRTDNIPKLPGQDA
jgi:hypothetical protein